MSKAWTDDEDATLAELRAQGWSLGAIGRKLGRTRGSVIGRAWRMLRAAA